MACNTCPEGVTYSERDQRVIGEPHVSVSSGGPVVLYEGQPLSTACERNTVVGQIPEVKRMPGFTIVRGEVITGETPNGGIRNMAFFFKSTEGDCYSNGWAKLASTCC